jgi:hypothetical protein
MGVSLAAHLGLVAALLTLGPTPDVRVEPDVMPVQLVAPRLVPPPPEPTPAPPSPAPPKAAPVEPPPQLKVRRPAPAPPDVVPLRAAVARTTTPGDELSDADLAAAGRAGSGWGGAGGCDMAGWLQGKLRGDARVQAAIAAVHRGRPLLVWNGAWVPHPGEEGAGLAQVREAIIWDVAFAPVACRAAPVRGLVLITLDDGPGAPRLVLGAGAWRWSDLLFSRSTAGGRR